MFNMPAPPPGDVLFIRGDKPGKPPRRGAYVIGFQVRDNGKELEASLPLGLARSADRFLPRQMRPYLDEFGVDLSELLDAVQEMQAELPQSGALTLFEMKEGGRAIEISLYTVG